MLSPRQVLRIFKRPKKEFKEDLRGIATSPSVAEVLVTTAALVLNVDFDILDAPEWARGLWEHLLTEWLREPRGPPPSARVAALLAAARRAAEQGIPVSVEELEKSLEEVEEIGEEET